MRPRNALHGFTIAVLVLFVNLSASADDKTRGADLISRSDADRDLRTPGSSPFRLKAKFELKGMRTGTVAGTWEETFLAPDQWRVQIDLPAYQEIIIRNGKDRYWRKLSSTPVPLRVAQMKDLLGFKQPVRLATPNYEIDKVRDRKINGQKVTCVHRKWRGVQEERCFDTEGRLMKVEGAGSETRRQEYSDFADFGGKRAPTKMRFVVAGDEAVRVEVTSLERFSGPASEVLTPDASFEVRAACDAATAPKPEYSPDPNPAGPNFRGTVVVAGEVGLDGRIHHAVVLQNAGTDLTEAVLDTVRKWRFKPADCNGTPIPFEMNVEVNFRGLVR
jgi:TonB family protein